MDDEGLTEKQEAALRFVAICDRISYAEVRRNALRNYADQMLTNPNIATAVDACLRYRREHGIGRPVTKLSVFRGGQR